MKNLEHKVYILQDKNKKQVDISDAQTLSIMINDQLSELFIEDLFRKHEFEGTKIVGYSYLQYYTLKDGYLVDKNGNKISFYYANKKQELYVKKVRNAIIMLPDLEAKDAYIRDFEKLIELAQKKQTPKVEAQIEEIREEQGTQVPEVTEVEVKESVEPTAEVKAEVTVPVEAAAPAPVAETPAPTPVAETPAPVVEEKKTEVEPVAQVAQQEPPVAVVEPAQEQASQPVGETKPENEEPKEEIEEKDDKKGKGKKKAQKKEEQEEEEEETEQQEVVYTYDDILKYYVNLGYKELKKDDYRLLYKENDAVYLIKVTGNDYEELHGENIEDDSEKFVYEFEEKGTTKKLTFSKKEEILELA